MAIPDELIARERQLLADALQAALEVRPRRRRLRLRKASRCVQRTWVNAGCFGPSMQWRLKKRPETT